MDSIRIQALLFLLTYIYVFEVYFSEIENTAEKNNNKVISSRIFFSKLSIVCSLALKLAEYYLPKKILKVYSFLIFFNSLELYNNKNKNKIKKQLKGWLEINEIFFICCYYIVNA